MRELIEPSVSASMAAEDIKFGKTSNKAKEAFRRPAYQGTKSESKSYSEHIMERFMKIK